jgi:hypothetical protein
LQLLSPLFIKRTRVLYEANQSSFCAGFISKAIEKILGQFEDFRLH